LLERKTWHAITSTNTFDLVRYWYANGRPSRVEVAATSSDLQYVYGYNTYYIQYNWHGDAVTYIALDGSGGGSWGAYDPWGNPTSWPPPALAAWNYYRWNGAWGYLRLDALNLYYVHGRWYNPETALWLSPDENGEYLYGSGQDAVNYAWLFARAATCVEENPAIYPFFASWFRDGTASTLNRLRRMFTGQIFGCRNVALNLPPIAFYAYQYQVDPAMIAAIVYYESDAFERIPTNLLFNVPMNPMLSIVSDLDLWQFQMAGVSSIGVGQMRTDTARGLEEESGLIRITTPTLPLLGKDPLIALRLKIDAENIQYIAANLAFIQRRVNENSSGLNLTEDQKAMLVLTGYNVGREEIVRALQDAQHGDRRALQFYLGYIYGQRDVGPIYHYFRWSGR
jgi:hypothetical protein